MVATFLTGEKYKTECRLGGKLVGVRYFHRTSEIEQEFPLKNGVRHGTVYLSHSPGELISAEPYRNGRQHGTAKEYSNNGALIGTYSMKHGTGIDLWRSHDPETGYVSLSEARYIRDGKWHGFEWWINEDQKMVRHERHFRHDQLQGIAAMVECARPHERRVSKVLGEWRAHDQAALRACESDPDLPLFREKDNRPQRTFPGEIQAQLAKRPTPASRRTS